MLSLEHRILAIRFHSVWVPDFQLGVGLELCLLGLTFIIAWVLGSLLGLGYKFI